MNPIAPSELIITPRGRIYHLDLHPDELADTVITVGDPQRVGRISQHFDRLDCQVAHREFVTHTGWIGQQRISVVASGIGPDNMDIVINELDALANIDFYRRAPRETHRALRIIRIGTSGSVQPAIPVDEFVVSAFGLGLDNLLAFYDYQPTLPESELMDSLLEFIELSSNWPVMPYVTSANATLLQHIGSGMTPGITLTSPGFYGPQGRQLRLPSRLTQLLDVFPNFSFRTYTITNFEMETAALFGLARMLGHRALSCNAIIANRARQEFSKDPIKTVDRLIAEVLEKITTLPA